MQCQQAPLTPAEYRRKSLWVTLLAHSGGSNSSPARALIRDRSVWNNTVQWMCHRCCIVWLGGSGTYIWLELIRWCAWTALWRRDRQKSKGLHRIPHWVFAHPHPRTQPYMILDAFPPPPSRAAVPPQNDGWLSRAKEYGFTLTIWA